MSTIVTRWWRPADADFCFAEMKTDLPDRTSNSGICFSGGGTRALTCAVGQLRGLSALGLLDRVRYISSVSGGTWGSTPFLWGDGAASDEALLGPIVPPEETTLDALDTPLPSTEILHTATTNLNEANLKELAARMPLSRVWTEAVGEVYLKPFGLHPDTPTYISGSPEEVARIRRDNPDLEGDFVLPRAPGRLPYHVINACGLGPQALAPLSENSPLSFEVTSLYGGNPQLRQQMFLSKEGGWSESRLGGGYLETFALGSPQLLASRGARVEATAPDRPYTLADAVGTSSAAFAEILAELPILKDLERMDPELVVWPVEPNAEGELFVMGDGGILDNYGLLSLLRRKVERIVVFINTSTAVDKDYDPATIPDKKVIDEYLPALFGFPMEATGVTLQNNAALAAEGWAPLIRGLQAAQAEEGPVVHRMTHQVRDNAFWGIEGGWSVDIAWCYLSRVPTWEERLPRETARAIEKGQRALFAGEFDNFPGYKLNGQASLGDVHLSVPQARLLADLCCWCVTAKEDLLRDMLC